MSERIGVAAPSVTTSRDERDRTLELALRSQRPYTGLRGFTPDPKLFIYVPMALALQQQIVPLVLVGDTLKVASASPSPELSLLNRRFPYVEVDIVLAPPSEVAEALERVQRQET